MKGYMSDGWRDRIRDADFVVEGVDAPGHGPWTELREYVLEKAEKELDARDR